ncbi:uncharacterized protein V1513DRAFT_451729 [Lipomyces chichibuensis]|uniref:uncharacterized protein n=1 Tax=Lipomyces chichibuensis TaxID=1546026 RepID=UPI00334437DC
MHVSSQRKQRPANLALSSATSLRDVPLIVSTPTTAIPPPSPSPSPLPTTASTVVVPQVLTRGTRPVSRSVSSGTSYMQMQQQLQQLQYTTPSQHYQQQHQAHLALLYSHHQNQLITPPEEYNPRMLDLHATEASLDHVSVSESSVSDGIDIIENIINDSDQEASVEATASLLSRQPSLRNANAEVFLDPDAFSDLADRQSDAGYAQLGPTSGGTGGSNSSGSSPAASLGKAIFKKFVPSKLRQGLKRRMSAPIGPTSPIASLSSPLFATSQQAQHSLSLATTAVTSPLTPQPQNGDGYFDLDIASNTNLETGEFFPGGAPANNSSRHSLLLSTGPASPATTSSPQLPVGTSIRSETLRGDVSYPVVVSPSPSARSGVASPVTSLTPSAVAALGTSSIPHSPLPSSTGQPTISSSVLAASAAMSAVISSSPPIPPSPLATRPPPELSEIPTPLSPTPISSQSSSVASPRPVSALAFEGSVPMIMSPSGSAGASRANVSSQMAGLSVTSLLTAPSSAPIPVQQLQQRLYHQLTLQESHDASVGDEASLRSSENTSAHAPTASMSSATSSMSGTQMQATVELAPEILDQEALIRVQIATLYEKMRAEDQAFEATENRLGESGWTSEEELAAISKNRLAARRKWEQAIVQAEASLKSSEQKDTY